MSCVVCVCVLATGSMGSFVCQPLEHARDLRERVRVVRGRFVGLPGRQAKSSATLR